MTRKQRIGRAFGAAAATYPRRATLQRLAADRLAGAITALSLPDRPKVLEIGCGTGFLTSALVERLPGAQIIASDLSPVMVAACRHAVGGEAMYLAMDGEQPCFGQGSFDLICSSLAFQWFEDLEGALERLCRLLRPGGRLVFSTLLAGTLAEWRQAHEDLGLAPGAPAFATPEALRRFRFEGASLELAEEEVHERYADGGEFIRILKEIGANIPTPARRPLSAPRLKRVLARFEANGPAATYRLGYASLRRPALARGVFVVGTDTEVGKTVVSACLARAWDADYWKPVQTGTGVDPGDTATVARLAGLPPERTHPCAYAFPEPLSPHAAAELAGTEIRLDEVELPRTDRPLIVEGAGGVLVPLNATELMIDLVQRLRLPVVVVARSTLGTINHTLLTLAALYARGVEVLGVVMNGPPSASNRAAIERHGRVKVLAEIPYTDDLSPTWVETTGETHFAGVAAPWASPARQEP